MLFATLGAVLTTFYYGFNIGIILFLTLRIVWGMSYAILRVSSLAYASEAIKNRNTMFGMVHGIKTAGAVMAMFMGTYLITTYDVKFSFMILGCLSMVGIWFSYLLPNIEKEISDVGFTKIFNLSAINILTFITSFIIDGVLVVTISRLLSDYSGSELLIVVSAYLLFRKLSSSVVSILSGWISDRFGVLSVFKSALLFTIIGLGFILSDNVEVGILLLFLFNGVIVALLPSIALRFSDKDKLSVLTSVTTWWDLGAATGSLSGIYLFQLAGYHLIFGILFCLFLISVLIFLNKHASFSKVKYLYPK